MHSFDSLFQFTPLREGRPGGRHARAAVRYFNSRPSARGDVASSFALLPAGEFQFTPLREGRPGTAAERLPLILFNSRPSARGDAGAALLASRGKFSIHAPPRGATVSHFYSFLLPSFFNSRPSARGDRKSRKSRLTGRFFNSRPSARGDVMRYIKDALKDFQFTPLREGRLALHQIDDAPGRISIHAPPRGATAKASGGLDHILISIHAPPRGATVLERLLVSVGLFQFTPLREGRQQSMQYNMSIRKIISIHAPPRGATAAQMFQAFLGSYFNSRPSARGDVSKSGALVMNEISIHAPPRGATFCGWVAKK